MGFVLQAEHFVPCSSPPRLPHRPASRELPVGAQAPSLRLGHPSLLQLRPGSPQSRCHCPAPSSGGCAVLGALTGLLLPRPSERLAVLAARLHASREGQVPPLHLHRALLTCGAAHPQPRAAAHRKL